MLNLLLDTLLSVLLAEFIFRMFPPKRKNGLPEQEMETLEFVVIGNNSKLELLVSSIGVHKHLGLSISYETWLDDLTKQNLLIPNGNAFFMDEEGEYYLTLDAAICLVEKANTEQSPGLLEWTLLLHIPLRNFSFT